MDAQTETARLDGDKPMTRNVLEYGARFKRLVNQSREPGFTLADWAPLAELVATDDFVRVGCFKEVVNWDQYVGLIHQWAPNLTNWDCTTKHVTEVNGRVFLELEERATTGADTDVVNSMSVYEFNTAGKLVHLDIYLQRAMDQGAIKGWDVSEA